MAFRPLPRRPALQPPLLHANLHFDISVHTERLQIDKAAAARFIKGALGSSRAQTDPFGAAEAGPSGTHTRFDNDEAEASAEQDETEGADFQMEVAEPVKEAEVAAESTPAKKAKAKRPKMDPFAGKHSPPSLPLYSRSC